MTCSGSRRILCEAAIALLVAIWLGACGSAAISGSELSRDIKEGFADQTGAWPELVNCPESVAAQIGQEFSCSVLISGGMTVDVVAKMTDNAGNFDWKPEREARDGTKIAEQVRAGLEADGLVDVQVSCADVLFANPGDSFTCKLTDADGVDATVTVSIAEDGSITWAPELD